MSELTEEERRLLRLRPEDTVEAVSEREAPPSEVASAFVEVALAEVAAQIEDYPDFDPVLPERRGLEQLRQWTRQHGVYEVPPEVEIVDGEAHRLEGSSLVDARRKPVLLRVHDGGNDLALRLDKSKAQVFELRLVGAPPKLRVAAPASPVLPAPDVEQLLGGAGVSSWLAGELETLMDSDDAMSHLVATGLLVRTWVPPTPDARAAELERLRRGEAGPTDRARDWMESLDRAVLETLAKEASETALLLPERAEAVATSLAAGQDAAAAAIALGTLLERDELESVRASLHLVDGAAPVSEALAAADRLLATHTTTFLACADGLRPRLEDRLYQTLAGDPDSWWFEMLA
jgi:hypothetical protein